MVFLKFSRVFGMSLAIRLMFVKTDFEHKEGILPQFWPRAQPLWFSEFSLAFFHILKAFREYFWKF